jgi:adenine-specific DNA methylase
MAKAEVEQTRSTALSFIESQFPVSKVSKESYKERMATNSQTLTGLGKWWGRKPLVLVRAAIIGLLMPASVDPKRDRQIFLKILTMDDEGLYRRKSKAIPLKTVYDRLTATERIEWFDSGRGGRLQLKKSKKTNREQLQKLVFSRMSYDEKLEYCNRPEYLEGPSEEAWAEINSHLGTRAHNLSELVRELGEHHFGKTPVVGDAFCGGGSIPFEAARIGCEAFGSDLNPIATLLTWASLNVIGGGAEVVQEVNERQRRVYDAVDHQVTAWGIEHNEQGHRADAYLYCVETHCPECGWLVPLAPSWVVSLKDNTVARLIPDTANKQFRIEIVSGVSLDEIARADTQGSIRDSTLVCPNHDCRQSTPIDMIRGDREGQNGTENNLRPWDTEDVVPHPDDTFQERLYAIRWVETFRDDEGNLQTTRFYLEPEAEDLKREQHVLELLMERIDNWRAKGCIPSRRIEPGDKTDEPIRTRGWTHWHHLFNPRQLLLLGTVSELAMAADDASQPVLVAMLLGILRCADFNCRLSRWAPRTVGDQSKQAFSNQALNTLFNYSSRGWSALNTIFILEIDSQPVIGQSSVSPVDARQIKRNCDIWLTDPPYADAIVYHELTEFFLAWADKGIARLFPDWHTDSRRALAVKGSDEAFRRSMVDCYSNLTTHMPDNGAHIVMFTHQDAAVWADLTLILWAAGLRVSSAWCIATETDTALKEGNYVQGTVLLLLRKQMSSEVPFLDEIYPRIDEEVRSQLDSMLRLDDKEDPNFGDTDYQLAAYAAALRVLTSYQRIQEIDVSYELSKPRRKGDTSSVEQLIRDAVAIACNYLVPTGFDTTVWKDLSSEERFYLKGVDLESHKEFRTSAYMELARGFGVRDYKPLLSSGKANQTRLKTATEFGSRMLGDSGFGASLVRLSLRSACEARESADAQAGRNWLKGELGTQYWARRKTLLEIMRYLASMQHKVERWKEDGHAAELVAGALENDNA